MLPSLAQFARTLRWVSPLEAEAFAEYQDKAFLDALQLEDLFPQLEGFWPHRGPVRDALAIVVPAGRGDERGVLLVEAKSHLVELRGDGCQATESSLIRIRQALDKTKEWLGVGCGLDWTSSLYQFGNRLAHLFFFREVAAHEVLSNVVEIPFQSLLA